MTTTARSDPMIGAWIACARRAPSAPALVVPGRRAMSFGELVRRIDATAVQLDAWGLRRGDVVAWPAIDREASAAALAIMPAAATLALLPPRLTADEYASLLGRLRAKAVAVPFGHEHPVVDAARSLAIAEIGVVADPAGPAGAFDLVTERKRESLDAAPSLPARVAYVTATSGTTGRAKLVPHAVPQIMVTTRALAERLAIGAADTSAHVAPLHLANGLRSAFLLPSLCGAAVCLLPNGDVDAFLAAIAGGEVTHCGASFTFFREVLERVRGGRIDSGRLRFLRVTSGRFDRVESNALEAAFGVPVVAGLASTETGTITHQRLPPAPRSAGSLGMPVASEIRIVGADGRVVAPGEIGEIQVRGPQVFDGYVDDPALDREAFVDGWLRMGDLGRVDAAGELYLVGRLHDIVNRGGEKISPVEVDEALRATAGVADAAAFGVPHPRLGEEIVAAVVRAPGADIGAAELLASVRSRLGPKRTPRHVWFVERLPRTESGKLQRRSLPEWVGFAPGAWNDAEVAAPAHPDSPVATALAAIWAAMLGLPRVGPHDDFFMLGGDSLRGAALLRQVRDVFGVALATDALFAGASTVATMAEEIGRARQAEQVLARITRQPLRSGLPLAATQRRAWFLHRLDPASSAYHEARLWQIDGALDVGALRAALAAVASRQSMLRTRFVTEGGEPRQVVDPEPQVDLTVVALACSAAEEATALAEAVRARAAIPFDLAAATPLRFTLFELGAGRHALLRVWHHVLGDALSARVLQKELSDAYAMAHAGRAPTLVPLAIDFADFTLWQQREDAAPGGAESLAFWTTRLADLPTLALPTDFRRPPAASARAGVVTARLSGETVAALKAAGRACGATPFAAFLAAFSALLSRLAGQTDFAIGTPVNGRPLPELADVIGFFANTVVFRADLSGDPDATALMARTRERVGAMLAHQMTPFDRVVEALRVPRDPSRNPLFQVAFSLRDRDVGDLALAGTTVERIDAGFARAKFDLSLALLDDRDGVDVTWEYCADLFERSTIERMSRQFARLVAAMAAAPDRSVTSLPLMDDAERAAVLAAATGATPPYADEGAIHRRFAAAAAASPDAMAFAGVSYANLDAQANRLARVLRARGAGRGAFVAAACRSAEDTALAWLATLKAGAAYLPIDPELPGDRLAFMLADAGVRCAVADEVFVARLARRGIDVVCPARDGAQVAAQAAAAPEDDASADDPAYLIYTSGSTGVPKGVVVPHRAVLRLVRGTDCAALGPGDAVAQLANPAFDASTFEFWGALLNGARLVPIAKSIAVAPRALAAAIAEGGVTALFLTTALFNAVARDAPSAFRPCKYVLFGGEAVEPARVAAVLAAGPPEHLLHVYGPTEATTFATWHDVAAVAPNAATVPIGRPLANTDVFVLRGDGELAAPGELGEIWIGGPGVAVGYLNQSERTAAAFVERSIARQGMQRLYRTGDLARTREDGAIEFVGRRDDQVKLRGHRIELAEIEAALARLPEIRAAAVALRGETSETRRIVAYCVAAGKGAPPSTVLRDLRAQLPEYMVPGGIVWVPELPLNASGKLDRRALAALPDGLAPRQGVHVAPRDMFEQVIAGIWEKLLGVRDVGVLDRFFEIGGHSLLAARLVDEIERETGLAAPLTALFTDDTIAGLARALREGAPDATAPIVAIHGGASRPPFVFLHGDFTAGGFYSRALAQALGADQPTLIVHPHGLVDLAIPETIEAMAADRIGALRALRPHGPYVVGGHCNGAFVAFEMARQLLRDGEQVPAVVMIEARAPRSIPAAGSGEAYVSFDASGTVRLMAARDRQSDAELRYSRAMDWYAGGACGTHIVIVRSQALPDRERDLGWSRFGASGEVHVLPGNHTSIITRYVGELAKVVRAAIDRAAERATA